MPLGHILAPQLARKAAELEAALNPGGQSPQGYLNQPPEWAGARGGPIAVPPQSDAERAGAQAPSAGFGQGRLYPWTQSAQPWTEMAPARDPNVHVGGEGAQHLGGYLTISAASDKVLGDPNKKTRVADTAWSQMRGRQEQIQRPDTAMRNAAILAAEHAGLRHKYEQPIPLANAAPAPAGEPVAFDEMGRPIYDGPKPGPKNVIQLPAGEAVAMTESGQPVDRKGKKMGYLDNRAGEGGYLAPQLDFKLGGEKGAARLDQKFRKHLDAMQYDRDKGVMKFPDGYFDGMSKNKRDEIEIGIEALRRLDHGRTI